MLIKYSGKYRYVKIYFNMKITFFFFFSYLCQCVSFGSCICTGPLTQYQYLLHYESNFMRCVLISIEFSKKVTAIQWFNPSMTVQRMYLLDGRYSVCNVEAI